jgi:hypothetical protein
LDGLSLEERECEKKDDLDSFRVRRSPEQVDSKLLKRAISNMSDRCGLSASGTREFSCGLLGNVLTSLDWRYLERAGVERLADYIRLARVEGFDLRFEHNYADGLVIVGREFGTPEEKAKRLKRSVCA